jgi:hypothetical protein
MKNYTLVEERLSSNPPKESKEKILITINRNVQSEGSRLIKEKMFPGQRDCMR